MSNTATAKQWTSVFIRIAVTSLLLWFLSRSLDFNLLAQIFYDVDWRWIAVGGSTILVARVLIAVRWKILLATHQLNISLWDLSKIIFVSMFFGQFLPGVIGTDVVRGYKVAKSHGNAGLVAVTLLFDRVIGIYGMAAVALIGVIGADLSGLQTGLLPAISLFCATLTVFAFIALLSAEKIQNLTWLRNSGRKELARKFRRLADLALSLTSHWGALFQVFIVSIAIVLVRCFVFFCLYRAFGSPVPIFALMVFIPMMFVAVLLPISIGGLGVRETTLVFLFGTIAVQAEISVGVGLMFQFLQILISIPGIVFWLSERKADDHKSKEATGSDPDLMKEQ